jgi:hypothetical protein
MTDTCAGDFRTALRPHRVPTSLRDRNVDAAGTSNSTNVRLMR